MNKHDTQHALVPRLRFPEFAGEPLRRLQLGDVTENCAERNGKGATSAPIMGVSKVDGIVPMEERLIGKDTARYKCLETNWFAYNPMRLNIGSIARWKGDGAVLVSPDYVVFRCVTEREPSIDPNYLDHFRCSDQWERFVGGSGDGGVRIRIYYKDLAHLPITLPSPAEQRKIADCLGSLDDLIAAEGRKLEALREHKQGLMQQLFPREGETRPRLRFPEFRNAPEWDRRTLGTEGEFLTSLSGKTAADFDAGGARFIPYSNVFENTFINTEALRSVDVGPHESQNAVRKGDLFFTVSSETQKDAGMSSVLLEDIDDCYLNSFCALFRFNRGQKLNYRFAGYLFRSPPVRTYLEVNAQGAIRYNISKGVFRDLVFLVPGQSEQGAIADCLAALDARITAQAEKLDALRTHKRGLMQRLFPNPETRG